MRIFALVCVLVWNCPGQSDRQAKLKRAREASSAGRYPEAQSLATELLTEAEASNEADSDLAADALEILADMAMITGGAHSPIAVEQAKRAVAIREKLHGTASRYAALSLYRLCGLLLADGRDEEARPLLERTVHIFETTPGRVENLAGAIGALGNLYVNLGEFHEAIKMFDRGLGALQAASAMDTRTAGNLLTNQAIAYRMTGNYAAARQCNDRALALYEKNAGPDHPLVTLPLTNIASLLVAMGKPAEAMPFAARAVAVIETATEKNPGSFLMAGSALEVLAEARAASDPAGALPIIQKSIAFRREHFGDYHPNVMKGLPTLAIIRSRLGDSPGALDAALESSAIGSRYVDEALLTLSEHEALLNAVDCSRGLSLALSLLAARTASRRQPDAARVLDAVVHWRARVFDEVARRRRTFEQSTDPEVAALTRAFTDARTELSRLAVKKPASAEYIGASQRRQAAERALASRSAPFRRQRETESAGLPEVRRALPPSAALVSFVRYDRACLEPAPHCRLFTDEGGRAYMALVTRQGSVSTASIPLGNAAEIDALVLDLRRLIARKAEAPDVDLKRSEAAYRAAAIALRRRVWDPLRSALGNAGQVFIVPDGSLHLINFAALPSGESSYMIETGPELHYLSSERDLTLEAAPPSSDKLLAFGDPSFNAQLSQPVVISRLRGAANHCASFQQTQFRQLPSTGSEVDSIAALWRASTSGNAVALKRNQATEDAFKRDAPGSRVLHLASHGFFLEDCASQPQTENPLLLSGLALAGANRRQIAKPDEEDGILTAEEVAAMPLDGLEWAVLSACDTGLGEIRDSEGVFGLRRAFQVAGARTVIMSLWPQDDEAARQWMLALYTQRFRNHATTSASVRLAALRVLRQRRSAGLSSHPWYWAGFVAAGDWR